MKFDAEVTRQIRAYLSRGSEQRVTDDAIALAVHNIENLQAIIQIVQEQQSDLQVAWGEVERLREELAAQKNVDMGLCRHCGEWMQREKEPVERELTYSESAEQEALRYYAKLAENPPASKSKTENSYNTRLWRSVRKRSLARSGYRCESCGVNQPELYVHHILPRRDGGKDEMENTMVLCSKCHGRAHMMLRRAKQEPQP